MWCEEHGSTKYASRRTRAGIKTPKPSCCPPRGKCPQHLAATKMSRSTLGRKAHDTDRNRDVLAELVDVWGVASIWSADLYKPVAAWVKLDGQD